MIDLNWLSFIFIIFKLMCWGSMITDKLANSMAETDYFL